MLGSTISDDEAKNDLTTSTRRRCHTCPAPRNRMRGRAGRSREDAMQRALQLLAAAGGLSFVALSLAASSPVAAEGPKRGGILKIYHRDSPASASIHEEATNSTNIPFMGIFNNL